MVDRKLLLNRWQTPDGTFLVSKDRHNYVVHVDKVTNDLYFLDGGLDYIRMSYNTLPMVDMCLYNDDDHSVLREELEWGTYGIDGDEDLHYIKVKDLDAGHIYNIIDYIQGNTAFKDVLINELEWRDNND